MDEQRRHAFPPKREGALRALDFHTTISENYTVFTAPHWSLIVVTAAMALAPWTKRRFSLRTLLIATTLVAAVLGLLVAVL